MNAAPEPPEINPRDVVPDYEADPSATGTARSAAPPDGVDQPWWELHPGGAKELRDSGALRTLFRRDVEVGP